MLFLGHSVLCATVQINHDDDDGILNKVNLSSSHEGTNTKLMADLKLTQQSINVIRENVHLQYTDTDYQNLGPRKSCRSRYFSTHSETATHEILFPETCFSFSEMHS